MTYSERKSLRRSRAKSMRKAGDSREGTGLPRDSVGVLQLQRLVGNQAVVQMLERKVGFEFESGWLVHKKDAALKKKDPIGVGSLDGYKLEADEADGGQSEIEFIVYPPVEESSEGSQRLADVMTRITQLGKKLEKGASERLKQFPLGDVTGHQSENDYLITPTENAKLEARPQITSGLDMAKIGKLETIWEQAKQAKTPAPAELEDSVRILRGKADQVAGSTAGMSARLRGLLTVIAMYIESGANPYPGAQLNAVQSHAATLNYPKQIGDVLLARTDFARLFALLPEQERTRYANRPDDFVGLVLNAVDHDLGVRRGDPLFARGIRVHDKDRTQGITVPSLTVGDWLLGILQGHDHLTKVKDAESMGEFATRTEPVGPARGEGAFGRLDAGIFEIRYVQGQILPLDRWAPFALECLSFITNVHASAMPD
jgi:hypothetical protein